MYIDSSRATATYFMPYSCMVFFMLFLGNIFQVCIAQARPDASKARYLTIKGEKDKKKVTSCLRVLEFVGQDFSGDKLDDYIEAEDKSQYQPAYWKRTNNPTYTHDCAGLVLLTLDRQPRYKIGADNFYQKFIKKFGRKLTWSEPLHKNDIVVIKKTQNSISLDAEGYFKSADHVAIVINEEPVVRLSRLKIRTKDEEEGTFENLVNLESGTRVLAGGVYDPFQDGKFWTTYGSIRQAQFWRIEKIPEIKPSSEAECSMYIGLTSSLTVNVFDFETEKLLPEGTVQVVDLGFNPISDEVPITKGSAVVNIDIEKSQGKPVRIVAKVKGYTASSSDLPIDWKSELPYSLYVKKIVDIGNGDLNFILNTTFDFYWGSDRKGTISFSKDGKAQPSWTKDLYTWTWKNNQWNTSSMIDKLFMGKDYIVAFTNEILSISPGYLGEIDPTSPVKARAIIEIRKPAAAKKPFISSSDVPDKPKEDEKNGSADKIKEADNDLQLLKFLHAGAQLTNPKIDDLIIYVRKMVSKYTFQNVKNYYTIEDCITSIQTYQSNFGNVNVFEKVRDKYFDCLDIMIKELEQKISNKTF